MSSTEGDNTHVIRVFCDYEAEGVWGYPNSDDYYFLHETDREAALTALESMGRSEDYHKLSKDWALLRDLELWNMQFSRWYLDFQMSLWVEGFPSPSLEDFNPNEFTQMGLQLAFRVKDRYPDCIVVFYDQVASDHASYDHCQPDNPDLSFWYRIEIGINNEMILLSSDMEGNPIIPNNLE